MDRIDTTTLEQLLAPAIDATTATARRHGLTDEQHADLATAVMLRALAGADREDPALAGRLHAALTA